MIDEQSDRNNITGVSENNNNSQTAEPSFDPTTAPPGSLVYMANNPILYDERLKCAKNYLQGDEFKSDVDDFFKNGFRQSGFKNLDRVQQSLYPGLYCIGAISSLGKTTFVTQLADNLASSGEHVLYFSLEMNHFELYSKSISRQMFLNEYEKTNVVPLIPPLSAIEIRRGIDKDKQEFVQAVQTYTDKVQNRMVVIPTLFSIDIEGIINTTKEYMQAYPDVKPVVIVDYLQIVKATEFKGRPLEARAAIDHIVHSLKCFQSEYKLVVIVISSLNRQNYLTPVDFESFKESGGLEYTCDYLAGLQLSIMNDELFSKANCIKEKRDAVRAAKNKNPRDVELLCLKNRFGRSGYSVRFNYYPANDVFICK